MNSRQQPNSINNVAPHLFLEQNQGQNPMTKLRAKPLQDTKSIGAMLLGKLFIGHKLQTVHYYDSATVSNHPAVE
jgi:hypothetical protein